jgi:hypothetical protein
MPNFNNGTIDEMGYGQEKSVEQNVEPLISDDADITHFIELLRDISDPRDNRGKRHELSFVLAVTTMAILSGKNHVSEIHRYICNKTEWLQEIFDRPNTKPISRAQLPRIIAIVDWDELNTIIEEFFGVTVENINDEWIAIDGKVLRGTITDNDNAHENEQGKSDIRPSSRKSDNIRDYQPIRWQVHRSNQNESAHVIRNVWRHGTRGKSDWQ